MKKETKYDRFKKAPEVSELKALAQVITSAGILQDEIETIEGLLAEKRKELNRYTVEVIPTLMASANVKKFETVDGSFECGLSEFISGSLPKMDEAREEALGWIDNNGGSAIIKNHFDIDFEKGAAAIAKRLTEILLIAKIPFKNSMDVHASTLKAWCKERRDNGEFVPWDKLGLFTGTVAKIRRKGVKKGDHPSDK